MGSSLSQKYATRPFGKWLIRADKVQDQNSLDLPVELFSYLVGLGDYHPPLGGYLLLMVALLSIAIIEAARGSKPCARRMRFWLRRYRSRSHRMRGIFRCKRVSWEDTCAIASGRKNLSNGNRFLAGGAFAALLIFPFLIRFAPHADALHNALRLVPRALHTPPAAGLLVFYPLLAVLILNAFFGERSKLSSAFCTIWIALLAVSEFVFVDDLYGGKFERFNTALKWWSWIYSGTLLTVGAINLRSSSRVCRWGTGAVLVLISAYGWDLYANLVSLPKYHLGQLDGAAWLRDQPADRAIMDFLKTQPQSVVLERLADRAYIPAPSLVIFSGQTALLGWANHEDTWRGYRADIDHRMEAIVSFYRGDCPTRNDGWSRIT